MTRLTEVCFYIGARNPETERALFQAIGEEHTHLFLDTIEGPVPLLFSCDEEKLKETLARLRREGLAEYTIYHRVNRGPIKPHSRFTGDLRFTISGVTPS